MFNWFKKKKVALSPEEQIKKALSECQNICISSQSERDYNNFALSFIKDNYDNLVIIDYSENLDFLRKTYILGDDRRGDNKIRTFNLYKTSPYTLNGFTINPTTIFSPGELSAFVNRLGTTYKKQHDDMWLGRAAFLLETVTRILYRLRELNEISVDLDTIYNFLMFENIITLTDPKAYPKLSDQDRQPLQVYLNSLPGYQVAKGSRQAQTTLDQHGFLQMNLSTILLKLMRNSRGADEQHISNKSLNIFKDNKDLLYVKQGCLNNMNDDDCFVSTFFAHELFHKILSTNYIGKTEKDVLYPVNYKQSHTILHYGMTTEYFNLVKESFFSGHNKNVFLTRESRDTSQNSQEKPSIFASHPYLTAINLPTGLFQIQNDEYDKPVSLPCLIKRGE